MSDYDYLIKFLALGDSGVGKTSFLHRYTDNTFTGQFISTVGIDFKEKKSCEYTKALEADLVVVDSVCFLQLWDTAGQERFRSLTTAFFRDAMGFILIFDITNEQSFLNIRDWLSQLKIHAYCETPDIILCGNKADLENRRQVSTARAKQLADQLGLPYFETSACTSINVEKSVDCLLDMVMQRIQMSIDGDNLPTEYLGGGGRITVDEDGGGHGFASGYCASC
ncbi:EG:80H7.4 protein [Aphelenchoides besseyi]|nr:EG:80H7.4 protein [Aphelenchoides besseyi]